MGALVCMSRRDIPVCPGDVIICRRSCAEPGSGLFAAHLLPHDVTLGINRWCQVPPACGGIAWRQDRQAKMHSDPDVIIFCWSRDIVLFCAQSEYLQTHVYVFTTRIVVTLTATTAILSRMCRQVWIGTFGICRLHARAPIPMQTNPGNKHARHIPMCRPAHGNKCSHRCISIARAFMGCPSDNLRGHQRRQIWCHVKSTFSVYLLLKYIDISLISYRLAMITR